MSKNFIVLSYFLSDKYLYFLPLRMFHPLFKAIQQPPPMAPPNTLISSEQVKGGICLKSSKTNSNFTV